MTMVSDYDPGNAESPQKHIRRPSHGTLVAKCISRLFQYPDFQTQQNVDLIVFPFAK